MKKVLVLMSTYNGQMYLKEQLVSIYAQKGVDCTLLVRDDGSSDCTKQILAEEEKNGSLRWYEGRNVGPARSFWDLLLNAPKCEWYAFSDQDDVWHEDKLKAALEQFGNCVDRPALYFGQTQLVDENLCPMDSVKIHPLLTYGEALMYQFVGGCTMVFNDKLRNELLKYTPRYMRMHDVWIYDVAMALGAWVCFDDKPYILYRQHSRNAVGQVNSSLFRWRERIGRLRKNERIRSSIARELWNGYAELMVEEHKELTFKVINYKKCFNKVSLICGHELDCANHFVSIFGRLSILFNLF